MTGYPYGSTVRVITPTLVADPYSGELTREDWTSPTVTALPGVGVGPVESTEPVEDGRSRVVTRVALYLRGVDVVISPRARVAVTCPPQYAGEWLVDGEPAAYVSPLSGWDAGVVVPLRRATG